MSKDQKYYRHWAYKTVFVYILGFIFMMFLAKTDVHNKYMIELYGWLIFWTRSFIRHNYFKFVWKDDLNVHIFQNRNWCSPKSDRWFFFLTLTVRGPFHRKDFKWKKYGGTGLISEKTEALYAELNERAEAPTGSYSATCDFLPYIYFVLVAKNH